MGQVEIEQQQRTAGLADVARGQGGGVTLQPQRRVELERVGKLPDHLGVLGIKKTGKGPHAVYLPPSRR